MPARTYYSEGPIVCLVAYSAASFLPRREFWEAMVRALIECFGDHRVPVTAFERGIPEHHDWKRRALSQIIEPPWASVPNIEDVYIDTRIFCFIVDNAPPNQDRSDRCCTCITALPLWRAKGTGPALTPRAFATAFFRAVDSAGGCYYGLADADERDALNGFGYYMASRAGGRPFTWRQDIERMDWLLSGEQRRTRIRHDAWVQYLPAPLLARLDHAGDFVERFVDRRTPDEDGTQFGERFPTGGAVLGVCEDPLTEMFGIGAYAQADRPDLRSAVWLRHEFRKAGML